MEQVFRVADRVTVLRRGTQVGTKRIDETTHNELVAMITGLSS
jgi:simple sugar transport system ATP-binding protein